LTNQELVDGPLFTFHVHQLTDEEVLLNTVIYQINYLIKSDAFALCLIIFTNFEFLKTHYMKKLGFLLIFSLFSFALMAQINYTDIIPDIILDGSDTCFIDIDADGIDDLKFTQEDSISSLNANGIGVTLLHYNIEFIGDNPSYDPGHLYPFKVDSNKAIDSSANNRQWVVKYGANDVVRVMHIHFFAGADIGEWAANLSNTFLGIRIKIASKWHYGWVGLGAPNTDASQLIVKDYALNMEANEKILAGQTKDFGPSATAVSYEDSLCGTVVGFVRRNTSNSLLYNIIYSKNNNGNYDSIAYIPANKTSIYVDYDTSVLFAPKTYKISAVDSIKGESLLSDSAVSGYLYVSPSASAHIQLNYHHFLGQAINSSLPLYCTDSLSNNLPFDSLSINDTTFIDQFIWSSGCHNYQAASVLANAIHISGYGIMDTLKSNPASNCLFNLLHPIADFHANIPVGSGSLPTVVQFYDLSKTAITDWLWDFGDGSTSKLQNPSHVYNQGGLYSVSLSVSNCFGSDSIIKSGFIYIGINLATEESKLKLYPNPAKEFVNIELAPNQQILSVKIYNLMGKLISSNENIHQSNYRLSIRDKAKGIYFIEVTTDLGVLKRKITVD